MAIILDEPSTGGIPVARGRAIGEHFRGALVRFGQRDVLKDGEPVLNDRKKPRQELVVHAIVMPGTTMEAGLRDESSVPEPGELVRLILRGRAFAEWIKAKDEIGLRQVGDVIDWDMENAQAYDSNGGAKGGTITDQDEVVKLRMKGTTVGVYGPLSIRRATNAEANWVQAAETAYVNETATKLDTPVNDAEMPF